MNLASRAFSALMVLMGSAALAQAPPAGPGGPGGLTRVAGRLVSIENDSVTVRDAEGKETNFGLAPNVTVVATRLVDKASIKPGDFVASANLSEGEGIGRSIEMRLFEPGQRLGEGNRPMTQPGAAAGQMMTNATVTGVAQTAAGLELDVEFPGGVRRLVVPADVTIQGSYPVDPATLTTDTPVTVLAMPGEDGALRATRIQVVAAPVR